MCSEVGAALLVASACLGCFSYTLLNRNGTTAQQLGTMLVHLQSACLLPFLQVLFCPGCCGRQHRGKWCIPVSSHGAGQGSDTEVRAEQETGGFESALVLGGDLGSAGLWQLLTKF